MTEYRHLGTDPASASWDSQVSTAPLDISQVPTQLLDPPEYLRPLLPPDVFSVPPPSPQSAHPHPPLPPPVLPPPEERDPRTAAITEHLRAAVRLNGEADQLLDALKARSAEANEAAQRWFSLMHTQRRSPEQAALYAELEAHALAFSRQLASLRQRHSACLAQARAHEDAARFIQSQHAPSDPRR